MKKRFNVLLLAVIFMFSFSACKTSNPTATSGVTIEIVGSETENADKTPPPLITADRLGNPITIPESIEKIISIGASNTEILVELGFGDKIIATDIDSTGIPGISSDIATFSMIELDTEQMVSMQPDVILTTDMIMMGADDPLKLVKETGICVIYIPSSSSIDKIIEDIRFISGVTNSESKGEKMIADMNTQINSIRELGAAIPEASVKNVYFEIAAAPYMYSFGKGVFLNEIIEIIGANNILGAQDGWISIADEAILSANPDVILTSVNYIEDPIGEIISRPGWEAVSAVKNNEVYYIDTNASNRPSHNIVRALNEIAKAVYPEIYK